MGLITGTLLLALLQGAPPVQQSPRATVIVYNFTVDGRPRDAATLADAASRATRHLVVILSRDSSLQLMQRSVADRQRAQDGQKPPAARFAIVGGARAAPKGLRIVWQLLSVEDLRIMVKDSIDTEPGREPEAASLIARRVSAALALPGVIKGSP